MSCIWPFRRPRSDGVSTAVSAIRPREGRSHGSVGYCPHRMGEQRVLHRFELGDGVEPQQVHDGVRLCYGIWETGAMGAMAGLYGMQELFHAYEKKHGQFNDVMVEPSRTITFTFANGEKNDDVSTCVFLRYFEGASDDANSCGLSFAVFDRSRQILLGMEVASAMRLVSDMTGGYIVYSRPPGRHLPTMCMPTGHSAWDLRPMDEDVRARQRARHAFAKDSAASGMSDYKASAVGQSRARTAMCAFDSTGVSTTTSDRLLSEVCQPYQSRSMLTGPSAPRAGPNAIGGSPGFSRDRHPQGEDRRLAAADSAHQEAVRMLPPGGDAAISEKRARVVDRLPRVSLQVEEDERRDDADRRGQEGASIPDHIDIGTGLSGHRVPDADGERSHRSEHRHHRVGAQCLAQSSWG